MRRVRLGVIGCGGIAQMVHLPLLRDLDDRFEIAALCDLDQAVVEEVARLYHVPALYTDWRDLVRADVEAVMVLSGGSHYPQIMGALESGRHVFTEKPMCFNLREGREIDEAVRASDRTLFVGNHKRYDPAYGYGLQLVRSIEDLRYVQINVLHPVDAMYREHYRIRRGPGLIRAGPIPSPAPGEEEALIVRLASEGEEGRLITEALGAVRSEKRVAYWVMIGSVVHQVNALRGLLGDPVEVVSTEVWQAGLCVTSVLRFKPDVRCSLNFIYLPRQKNYAEEYAFFGADTRVRIRFPSPYLLHTPAPVTVQRQQAGRLVEENVIVSYDEAFQLELADFHDCVVSGKRPLTDSTEALADIACIQQIASKITEP